MIANISFLSRLAAILTYLGSIFIVSFGKTECLGLIPLVGLAIEIDGGVEVEEARPHFDCREDT